MKTLVFSREGFIKFQKENDLEKKYAVISISAIDEDCPRIECDEVLYVHFNDVGEFNRGAITPEIARDIIKFAASNKGRQLIVHCGAGLSRSPAVALALAALGYGEYDPQGTVPNVAVKAMIMREGWKNKMRKTRRNSNLLTSGMILLVIALILVDNILNQPFTIGTLSFIGAAAVTIIYIIAQVFPKIKRPH